MRVSKSDTTPELIAASDMSGRRVAVFGGGIAGLTAAHELAERGFLVDVYERHSELGGKVRSFSHRGTGRDGRADLPGNMGGHFFGNGYAHVGDTMQRIPIGDGKCVLDNLTSGGSRGLSIYWAWRNSEFRIPLPSHRRPAASRQLHVLREAAKIRSIASTRDVAVLATKVLAIVTSGANRRWGCLEHITLGEFMKIEKMSSDGKRFADFPASLGVATVNGANVRVVYDFLRFFIKDKKGAALLPDVMTVLNGPENEAWIDPWSAHLGRLGVRFHLGCELSELQFEEGIIAGAKIRRKDGAESDVSADWFVVAIPADKSASLMSEEIVSADPTLGKIQDLNHLYGFSLQILLKHRVPELPVLFEYYDAPWGNGNEVLSSVWDRDLAEQYGDGEAVEYVSIQIDDLAWHKGIGFLYGKPAKECSRAELEEEILAQLRHFLPNGDKIFAPDAIHSVYLFPGLTGDESVVVDEPLFGPTASCWENQPSQVTKIRNLFLAGAYTRNRLGGDTMEGANESGRRAADGILAASDVPSVPVRIIEDDLPGALRLLHRLDDWLYARGLPNAFDIVSPYFPTTQPPARSPR